MDLKNRLTIVPILKKSKLVYFKVDIFSLLIFFLLVSHIGFAQNQKRIDSLLTVIKVQEDTVKINTYRELFKSYIFVDSKLAKPYLDANMELSKELNNKSYIAKAYNLKGFYLWSISEYQKSVDTFNVALHYYQELNDQERVTAVLNNKANSLRKMGKYKEALETHMQSLKIKEQLHVDAESLAASYLNIGNLQGDIENYEESNLYYYKAKAIYEDLDLEYDLEAINLNIAINLKNTAQYEKAIPLFLRVAAYSKKYNYNNDLAGVYDNLGELYKRMDSLDLAMTYFEKSLAISKDYGETWLEGINLRNIGEVLLRQNKPYKALPYLEKSLTISQETNTRKKMIRDYLLLHDAHKAIGNYKEALDNLTAHKELYEEVLNEDNIARMNELEISYQTEKKEQELALQKADIEVLTQKEKISRTRQLWLGIASLMLVICSLGVIYGLRQKMKRNKAERAKLDASLEFKEKELTTHALHLAHKNEVLLDLKSQLKELKRNSNNATNYQSVINTINLDINNDNNWEQFRTYFEDVHKGFNSNVKRRYPEVSSNDLRLMALLKMNLSSKEIANILNISTEGVKKARYRLRKKLNLSTEDSLQELVIEL